MEPLGSCQLLSAVCSLYSHEQSMPLIFELSGYAPFQRPWNARISRYALHHAYYSDTAYNDLKRYAAAQKLYAAIRTLFSPCVTAPIWTWQRCLEWSANLHCEYSGRYSMSLAFRQYGITRLTSILPTMTARQITDPLLIIPLSIMGVSVPARQTRLKKVFPQNCFGALCENRLQRGIHIHQVLRRSSIA